jgi:precorrin-6B methylase 2
MADTPVVDLEALTDLRTPWCVHVAATLRIAEHLATGPSSIHDLAMATGSDTAALHCVLGHLASKGLFAEVRPGTFALNVAARGLLDPMLQSMLDLDGLGGRFAHAWGTLLTLVRTGRPGYEQVFGRPFFDDLEAHPRLAQAFDAMMGPAGHGTPSAAIDLAGGWEPVRWVVDVGGGTGALLAEVLRAHPPVHGTLVDRPATVARSSEVFEAAGVAERVTLAGQSFFEPLPAGADLYLLRKVINDWPDAEAQAILKRCAEAARPAGRVVVIGGHQPDDAPRRLEPEMVLVGGKQRTRAEMQSLAEAAGLVVAAAADQGAAGYITECRVA